MDSNLPPVLPLPPAADLRYLQHWLSFMDSNMDLVRLRRTIGGPILTWCPRGLAEPLRVFCRGINMAGGQCVCVYGGGWVGGDRYYPPLPAVCYPPATNFLPGVSCVSPHASHLMPLHLMHLTSCTSPHAPHLMSLSSASAGCSAAVHPLAVALLCIRWL